MMYPQRADAAARRLTGVLGILNQSASIEEALPELRRHDLAHTEDAARMVLRRAGLGKLSDHLGTAGQLLAADRDFIDRAADVAAENDDGPPTLQGGFEAQAENDERPVRDFLDRMPERGLGAIDVVEVVALFPDIHAGFHDERAVSCAIKVAELAFDDFPVEMRHLVQLGDLLDNDAVSPHPRSNLPSLTFQQEVAEGRRLLSRLEAVECGKRSLCLGNHDFWIERHKIKKCPEFAHLISVDKLLELDAHGWNWVPYHRSFTIGRTRVSHEFGKAGGNAATAGLNSPRGKVFGHTHRLCVTYAGVVDDVFRVSATLGYLGTVEHATYGTDTNFEEQWCQGMGIGYLDSRGFLWLQPVPILNGTAIFNGKMVQA